MLAVVFGASSLWDGLESFVQGRDSREFHCNCKSISKSFPLQSSHCRSLSWKKRTNEWMRMMCELFFSPADQKLQSFPKSGDSMILSICVTIKRGPRENHPLQPVSTIFYSGIREWILESKKYEGGVTRWLFSQARLEPSVKCVSNKRRASDENTANTTHWLATEFKRNLFAFGSTSSLLSKSEDFGAADWRDGGLNRTSNFISNVVEIISW